MSKTIKDDPFDLNAGIPKIDGKLRPTPKYADRISKRVIGVALTFVGLLVVIFLVSLDSMDTKKKPVVVEKPASKSESDKAVGNALPEELLGSNPSANNSAVAPASLVKAPVETTLTSVENPVTLSKSGGVPALTTSTTIPPEKMPVGTNTITVPPLTPEKQAINQAKIDRLQRSAQARLNGLASKSFEGEGAVSAPPANGIPGGEAMMQAMRAATAAGASQSNGPATPDSEQDEKLNFIKNAATDDRGYHPHMAIPALSVNEIKTGSFISMTLEQGINSDLPGMITARVTENIYDSISGCRLLIPVMSKVVGKYSSKVALGQGRMLVVWNTVIFPDGAELNLAGMQGYDTSGAAGLQSDVDNHYLRLFGLTFGMSMVTAGVQLSVPQSNASAGAAPTPAQTVSTALAQQFGQLGAQIIGKYIAVQPTLRNYPGERFIVVVPHTIVFSKVWRNRCEASR